jgi:lipopolysaccharide/colanic/teichoic acid biosynthesis glycosyltransferase
MLRRLFDLAVAAAALVISSPLLLLALIAVPLESRGSPIFRQRRVGLDGREFEVIKLRTMVSGAENLGAGLAVAENDDRITRLGALLRRSSVDELPNLINVLRGEMAIIGPRPTVSSQVEQYTPRQLGRLAVRPGITGWAQVNGRAGLPWDQRIELDLWYIENRSWKLDRQILRRSFSTVFGGEDLYREDGPAWTEHGEDE